MRIHTIPIQSKQFEAHPQAFPTHNHPPSPSTAGYAWIAGAGVTLYIAHCTLHFKLSFLLLAPRYQAQNTKRDFIEFERATHYTLSSPFFLPTRWAQNTNTYSANSFYGRTLHRTRTRTHQIRMSKLAFASLDDHNAKYEIQIQCEFVLWKNSLALAAALYQYPMAHSRLSIIPPQSPHTTQSLVPSPK
ncbi:hypothetical protein Hypma_013419 [Hypsizygus marmoreus]|uniref:Uncharacterized protein n=1 Tax=Hypsizygus marmoreus TaxID=39966 RepID=A0A369JGH8_HYPMA|nr:hypothetical protein Hypma_013419 [Hypsizygus marmoreus]